MLSAQWMLGRERSSENRFRTYGQVVPCKTQAEIDELCVFEIGTYRNRQRFHSHDSVVSIPVVIN